MFSFSASNGQSDGRFGAAILAGANFSQIDGDAYAGYKKVGINAGVRGTVEITDKIFASMDLLYSQKGAVEPRAFNGLGTVKVRLDFDYVEIPLMINYNDRDRFLVGAGIGINRLIDFRHMEDDLQIDSSQVDWGIKNTEFEGIFNATFPIGDHFGINFKYGYSLNWLSTISFVPDIRVKGFKHNTLALRAVYFF